MNPKIPELLGGLKQAHLYELECEIFIMNGVGLPVEYCQTCISAPLFGLALYREIKLNFYTAASCLMVADKNWPTFV